MSKSQLHSKDLVQEAPRRELIENALVERGLLVELKVDELLLVGQVGELQIKAHCLLMTEGDLGIEQIAEKVRVGPACRGGLLCGLVELLFCHIEAELLQGGRAFCS